MTSVVRQIYSICFKLFTTSHPRPLLFSGRPEPRAHPAQMAALIEQMVSGIGQAGDAGFVPPADIIVDDLLYPTQNPFEIDEVSEAIDSAHNEGVVYVSAAGDGGHYETSNSTSNVYVADFNSQAPATYDGIYDAVFGNLHAFDTNEFELTLSEPHLDICVFWNEDPDDENPSNDISMLAFPGNDPENLVELSNFGQQPGGCLSEQYGPAPELPTGTKLLFEDFSRSLTHRFIVVGYQGTTSFGQIVYPQLDDLTGSF